MFGACYLPCIFALLLVHLHPMFPAQSKVQDGRLNRTTTPLTVKTTVVSHLALAAPQQWLVRLLLDVVAAERIGHLDLTTQRATK